MNSSANLGVYSMVAFRRPVSAFAFTHSLSAVNTARNSLASLPQKIRNLIVPNCRLEREISVAREVGRIVTSTLDIQQVYEEFAAQLKKLVDFDRIAIRVIDHKAATSSMMYVSGIGPPGSDSRNTRPLNELRSQAFIGSPMTIVVDDIAAGLVFPLDQLYLDAGLNSLVLVSLVSNGHTVGSLLLRSRRVGAFKDRDRLILERLANQIAPAVENARLYEESIKIRKAYEESEARFRRFMMQAADPHYLSESDGRIIDVTDLACQGLGYTREELLEMRTSDFSVGAPKGRREEVWNRLLDGEIVTVEGTHRRKDGTAFPVEIRVSIIELDGHQYRYAIARDITERKRAQVDQLRRAREDSVMAEIGKIVSSSLDLGEVYEPLGREIQRLIPLDLMILALLQPDGESFLPGWLFGTVMPEQRVGVPTPLDGTMAGRVTRTGAPMIFEAENDEGRIQEFPGMIHDANSGLRSFMAVPLISMGNVTAVLQLRTKEPRAYSQRHLDLAVRIADQISGAISTSQLFQQQKDSQERIVASLREKEVLLKEINHRVKNNLQIISSLLNLQSRDIHDELARDVLRATQGRIRAMATIHEKLYQSEDLAEIDFGEYLKTLTSDISRSYEVSAQRVGLIIDAPEISL